MLVEKPATGGTSPLEEIHTEPIRSPPQKSAQGGNPIEPQRTAAGGSSFAFQYGRRHVNAYPITEGELSEIGTLKAAYCVVPGAPISSGLSDFEA